MNNIKWVAALTLVLGYVAAQTTTAVFGGNGEDEKATLRPLGIEESSRTNWQPATIETKLPAAFTATRPNLISRADSLQPVFDTLCLSGRPLRVFHLGDSHVAGKDYPQAVRQTLEQAWGKAPSDSLGSGVHFTFEGKNGATTVHFATAEHISRIAAHKPDLLILSFGTNECHSLKYNEGQHREQLAAFFTMLHQACPQTVVLLTTPPGACLKQRTVKQIKGRNVVRHVNSSNPMSTRCAAELENFGLENGLAVWDLNSIGGGKDAVNNWLNAGMFRPDRIHFTPEGYQLQGHLLGEAILAAYNDYLSLGSGGSAH